MLDEYAPLMLPILTGITFSLLIYLKKLLDHPDMEWNPVKFAKTVLAGLIVGITAYYSGTNVSLGAVEEQIIAISAAGGGTIGVQTIGELLFRGSKLAKKKLQE